MRCPCLEHGECPIESMLAGLRAMDKRLLEGVDELYKLNNLDTDLASEHDDRIKQLEERVAALEQAMDLVTSLQAILGSRQPWKLEAGGPESATPLMPHSVLSGELGEQQAATPSPAWDICPICGEDHDRAATPAQLAAHRCKTCGVEECECAYGCPDWQPAQQPREGGGA